MRRPATSPCQARCFVEGLDLTMGRIGLPGRSLPEARRGLFEFARPATEVLFDRTLFCLVTLLFCFPFFEGVLKRLSRAVAGLSPLVFWATAAGALRISTRINIPRSFRDLAWKMVLFAGVELKKWSLKHAKLNKIYYRTGQPSLTMITCWDTMCY